MMTRSHFRKLQNGREEYQRKRTILVIQKTKKLFAEGEKEVGKISKRELFLTGIILYWAEGFKHPEESGLGLATSDPEMARFYIRWLDNCLGVRGEQLKLRVTANFSHKYRISNIQSFWSHYLKVPKKNFTKPFFQRVIQKKHFSNEENYHGVVRIHVAKSLDMLRKMRGWLSGVKMNNSW